MKRYLHEQMLEDLHKKIVFVTGPRQVGKTYLAKQIMGGFSKPQYLNYDSVDDRKIIQKRSWRLNSDLVVFDEIHKMKDWKIYLKGVYDSRDKDQEILVTGSSRLETYRQSGESLAGRYLHLRLNPISVSEVKGMIEPYSALERLNTLGGFPEPFLSDSEEDANRWRNQYYIDLVREDILEFSRINEINTMRMLLELLRFRVGSPVSYQSLARDLQVSPNTVKRYIQILESLYIIFLVRPYYRRVSRSILKEPKLYFYDSGYVKGEEGIRLENTCAVCLLKFVQYLHDARGKSISLQYIKTKEGKEIDFVLVIDEIPNMFIEVKLMDSTPARSLMKFAGLFPETGAIQLVHNLKKEEHIEGIEIVRAGNWLSELPV